LLIRLSLCSLGILLAIPARGETPKVVLLRTPNGGIQPRSVVDGKGVVHLIYFKGEAKGGDVFYVRRQPGSETFSEPIQVNSRPRTAIATGTIRGAQLALGRNGRVHVAWNGNQNSAETHEGAPLWYARLDDAGSAFEPQRDLINYAGRLDGGGTVAADGQGNVYVLWHGAEADKAAGEENRAVFLARSSDDGRTFAREKRANPTPTGACACCGMRAFVDTAGNLFGLYRMATAMTNRDEALLVSRDHGGSFELINTHPWKLAACPMSSASLTESKDGVLAAWETAGQVYFSRIAPGTLKVSSPISPPGNASRKHPVIVGNDRGETLLVWTEGTGWQRGGALAWQLFDSRGQPTNEKGRIEGGISTWSFAAAIPQTDAGFVIFH
jgi:hypothetical protein